MIQYRPFSNGSEAIGWYEDNCAICKPKCPKKLNINLSFITGTINQATANWIGYDEKYVYKDFVRLNATCKHKNKYVRPKRKTKESTPRLFND